MKEPDWFGMFFHINCIRKNPAIIKISPEYLNVSPKASVPIE